MNELDLMKGLSDIDDAYIDEAKMTKKNKSEKNLWIRWGSIAAVLCLLVTILWPLSNGTLQVRADNLMEGISPDPVEQTDLYPGSEAVLIFSAELMRNANQAGENTLISPISALYALSMTANGAKGDTLQEMETVLGMPLDDLNQWLYSYGRTLETEELKLANSIWFSNQEGFEVNREFLQCNADYYGVDIYTAPFDASTVRDINRWVAHKTDGMIPEMVDDVEGWVMALINALCFEAAWEEEYEENDIVLNPFSLEDGTTILADYLVSSEDQFLQDDLARGFIKEYQGGRYAFLAMLPNEGVTVEQYIQNLSGTGLQQLLSNAEEFPVSVWIPKFETEFSVELVDALKRMGMELAFDNHLADFSGIAPNVYIDTVKQKTYICVDEQGTKAAASTIVGMPYSAPMDPDARVEFIKLDRPFVYLLMDMQTGIPIFIGTMMNPGQ